MLEACAKGFTRKERTHNWVVMWKGRTFPTLPLGPHGSRVNPDIQIGKVKQMVRHLGIDQDCANGHLPQLRLKPSEP
jgi:hypothetical protein